MPAPRPYQTQRQLTREEVDQVIALHEARASMRQIADELGVHRTTILKRLQGLGITTRFSKLTSEQVRAAARLYADGWTLDRIAKRYHVAASTVREYLLADGVELRPRGRAKIHVC
jgi:IS30 family transposase